MTSYLATAADNTAAILQQAAHGGRPVMIPGARETRVGPAMRVSEMPAPAPPMLQPLTDRARLEHGREGGGALRDRIGGRRSTIFGRIWRATTGALNTEPLDGLMAKPIVITRKLLTAAWTADVDALEAATSRFGPLADECRVAFFEVAGDTHLHVNVTHRFARMAVGGWAGPANVAEGFVHNRRFASAPQSQMIRHIRDVVFAARP